MKIELQMDNYTKKFNYLLNNYIKENIGKLQKEKRTKKI